GWSGRVARGRSWRGRAPVRGPCAVARPDRRLSKVSSSCPSGARPLLSGPPSASPGTGPRRAVNREEILMATSFEPGRGIRRAGFILWLGGCLLLAAVLLAPRTARARDARAH